MDGAFSYVNIDMVIVNSPNRNIGLDIRLQSDILLIVRETLTLK